jgi:hypothetical protein
MSLEPFFQSGSITYVILAVMLAEGLFLARYFKRFPGMISGLAAGASLVLALRAALIGQGWIVIAAFLTLSFVFHLMEIWQWLRLAKQ